MPRVLEAVDDTSNNTSNLSVFTRTVCPLPAAQCKGNIDISLPRLDGLQAVPSRECLPVTSGSSSVYIARAYAGDTCAISIAIGRSACIPAWIPTSYRECHNIGTSQPGTCAAARVQSQRYLVTLSCPFEKYLHDRHTPQCWLRSTVYMSRRHTLVPIHYGTIISYNMSDKCLYTLLTSHAFMRET